MLATMAYSEEGDAMLGSERCHARGLWCRAHIHCRPTDSESCFGSISFSPFEPKHSFDPEAWPAPELLAPPSGGGEVLIGMPFQNTFSAQIQLENPCQARLPSWSCWRSSSFSWEYESDTLPVQAYYDLESFAHCPKKGGHHVTSVSEALRMLGPRSRAGDLSSIDDYCLHLL